MVSLIDIDFTKLYGPGGIVAFDQIPQELRDIRAWVMWKMELSGQGRPTKVLYQANGRGAERALGAAHAKSNDPDTWTTFDDVRSAYKIGGKWGGIGFVFSKDNGIVGIDLDHHVSIDSDGVKHLDDFARDIVTRCVTYTEMSPRGEGLHLIVRAEIPQYGRNNQQRGFEIYDDRHFFTFTGDRWPGTPATVEEQTAVVTKIHGEVFGALSNLEKVRDLAKRHDAGEELSEADLMTIEFTSLAGARMKVIGKRTAERLYKNGPHGEWIDDSLADFALCKYFACKFMQEHEDWDREQIIAEIDRVMRQSALYRYKWDEPGHIRGLSYGDGTIENAVDHVWLDGKVADLAQYKQGLGKPGAGGGAGGASLGGAVASGGVLLGLAVDGSGDGDGDGRWADLGLETNAVLSQAREILEDDDFDTGPGRDAWEESEDDIGNSKRLAKRYGGAILYLFGVGWHLWNGVRWEPDMDRGIYRKAEETILAISEEIAVLPQAQTGGRAKHLANSSYVSRIDAMIKLTTTKDGIGRQADNVDVDPFLLNTIGGAIDLRTGELQKRRRKDYFTKIVELPYDPQVDISEWAAFIKRVTSGDEGLARFVQQAVGYSLTGNIREQCLFFVYGKTQTGKSTFSAAIRNMMGGYCESTDASTFMKRRFTDSAAPRPEIVRLRGARLVQAIEADQGVTLSQSLVKQVTGGEPIVARKLNTEPIRFTPTFKIWLVANDAPHIPLGDDAMWRRIHRMPFMNQVPEEDVDRKIIDEWAAAPRVLVQVLKWAVDGAVDWWNNGLIIPESVIESTRAYKEEEDYVGNFIKECCIAGDRKMKVQASALYAAYRTYAEGGRDILSGVEFGRRVGKLYERVYRGGVTWYLGLGLLGAE